LGACHHGEQASGRPPLGARMASCSRWLVPWNVHLQMIIHSNVSIIAAKFSDFSE
jgi:hypothetical protein